MANSFKATAISKRLADDLRARGFTTLGITETFDTDGYPLITVGASSPGGRNAVIKTMQYSQPLAKDAFGNTANQFGPHVVMFATEVHPASSGDTITVVDQAGLLTAVINTGCYWQWWQEAVGTAPAASTFTTTNKLKVSTYPDPWQPILQMP